MKIVYKEGGGHAGDGSVEEVFNVLTALGVELDINDLEICIEDSKRLAMDVTLPSLLDSPDSGPALVEYALSEISETDPSWYKEHVSNALSSAVDASASMLGVGRDVVLKDIARSAVSNTILSLDNDKAYAELGQRLYSADTVSDVDTAVSEVVSK